MKTTQECYQALINGEKLINGRYIVMLDSNGALTNENGTKDNWGFQFPEDWSIYTPTKWYDNIPECLIPCRVWNYGGPIRMAFLKAYDDSYAYPFITSSGCNYGNAEPLTKQEIQTLLDNAPETEDK